MNEPTSFVGGSGLGFPRDGLLELGPGIKHEQRAKDLCDPLKKGTEKKRQVIYYRTGWGEDGF